MKKLVLRRVAECLCTLAVLAAPVASEFCRALFYQERDPDGMEEFVKKRGLTVYNPLYINNNGDTVASFSDWKPYEIMYPKGQHFPLHHYSTTIKQYSSRNAYSYNIKYFVGNSNFCDFGGAFKAGKLSLPLKVK